MIITKNGGHGREVTVAEAIEDKLHPSAYSYEGTLEKLEERCKLQSEMIGKLVSLLVKNGAINAEKLSELLGYSYVVSE